MQIRLAPAYSQLAAIHTVEALGLGEKLPTNADGTCWRLSQHQVETYRALTDPAGPDVVFNTAITGDGKSLAGQLPSLIDGWRRKSFAMYPTNELIRDQQRQAQLTWSRWKQHPSMMALDSSELDRKMESDDFDQRGTALMSVLRNHDVILTNPDIFHYIMQAFYTRTGKSGDAADKIFALLVNLFQQFTFDEFHIFEIPQIVSVVNALLLIHEMTRGQRRQFLFQSATPNPLMLQYLQRAGITVEVVNGNYHHGRTNPDADQWRLILRGCDLHFDQGKIEEWVEQHLHDTLLPFFLGQRPGAKGAIIVNSVAQAKRLVQRLQGEFGKHGLTIGENTGLTSRTRRSASYECDLLVGTSTVDVGVDFQINFLLFESRDAGSFLQRLGRLGRHDGYSRDGLHISFQDRFVAYALLPPWINEALCNGKNGQPAALVDGAELDRETLTSAIQGAFFQPAAFENYARDWGILQSMRIVRKLNEPLIRGQYEAVRKTLTQRYSATFGVSVAQQNARYSDLYATQRKLYDEVTAFRGGSYFTCAVIDATDEGADQIKTYGLFWLIANADLSILDEDEFWGTVRHWGIRENSIKRQDPIAFFRLRGFLPERSNFRIKLKQDVGEWDSSHFGVARLIEGIQLLADYPQNIPGYNVINRRLAQRSVPALICMQQHPMQLKSALRLPMLFALYELESMDGLKGSIAFGREALLLHAALKYSRLDCGGSAMIF